MTKEERQNLWGCAHAHCKSYEATISGEGLFADCFPDTDDQFILNLVRNIFEAGRHYGKDKERDRIRYILGLQV